MHLNREKLRREAQQGGQAAWHRRCASDGIQGHGHVVPRGHEPHPILQLLESAPVQQVLCIVEPQGVFCQGNTNERASELF